MSLKARFVKWIAYLALLLVCMEVMGDFGLIAWFVFLYFTHDIK